MVVVLASSIALVAIPPWRDPRHPNTTGAADLIGGGALLLAAAVVIKLVK